MRASGGGFASGRFSRPSQLDPAVLDRVSGGVDSETVSMMSHETAAALLDRVHHSVDPQVVERTLNLVQNEGVEPIADLWADAGADTLPGTLWRLYMLREWMRDDKETLARLWRRAEPTAGAASAVAGVDEAPTPQDIEQTADSILRGAFTGDFAMALERAGAFCAAVASARDDTSESGQRLARTAGEFRRAADLWRRGALY